MSDNQGERPDQNVPASTPQDLPATPAASQTPAATPAASSYDSAIPPRPAPPVPPASGWQQPSTGAPAAGAAFAAPHATQATLPLPPQSSPSTPRSKGAGKVVGLIVAAALVGGAAGLGGAYAGLELWGDGTTAPAAGPQTITVNDTDDVNQTTAIAANVVPGVVTIAASDASAAGTGSGVILSEDGYVVTNAHVVTLGGQSADPTVTATASDGRVYDASIVGVDPIYDLAVIKLEDASDLTPVEFADSNDLNVGDEAIAVGAPLGLSNTVTTGIVSALNRSISVASAAVPEESDTEDPSQPGQDSPFFFDFGQGQQPSSTGATISIAVIQTDAAINPGNSGGALVDDEGRLIGINVAIASAGGSSSGESGSIGVGFAIPSDIVKRVTDEIIETGSATHGLLGASVRPAASVEGAEITGAYIAEVVSGGAADAAGLREGDVVTAFDGKPVTSSTDLTAQVRALAAGADTSLTFVRDGESRTVDVTLGELGS